MYFPMKQVSILITGGQNDFCPIFWAKSIKVFHKRKQLLWELCSNSTIRHNEKSIRMIIKNKKFVKYTLCPYHVSKA